MLKEKLKEIGLTDEQAEKVIIEAKSEIDGNYIPKSRFDEINNQLKTAKEEIKKRDVQLEELKGVDANELKAEIERLKEENRINAEANEAAIKQMKIDNAVEKALINANAKNSALVMPLLAEFLQSAEIDESGNIKGLDKEISELTKNEKSSFLFENTENKGRFEGLTPAQEPDNTEISKGAGFAQRYNSQFDTANNNGGDLK